VSDQGPDADLLYLDGLASLPAIAHAFETRHGSIRDALPSPVARLQQVHGNTVLLLPHDRDQWSPFLEPETADRPPADALITNAVGVTVSVAVADCLPILIADPDRGAVAAVHGGWRGLAADIVSAVLARMGEEFGCLPTDCLVGIGPGIGPCCYEVGEEVISAFDAVGMKDAALQLPGRPQNDARGARGADRVHCNLPAVATSQARRCGVPAERVFGLDLCTRCHSDRLWSYRRLGSSAGRMLAGIAVIR
jgi:YfiH family protein